MADNSDFVHLHAHGEFSMLDGVGTIDHVVGVAKQKGFRALAQTDHGNVSGALKFHKECSKQGIKAIVGCEIYVVDDPSWRKPEGVKQKEERYHTIVLAKNWDGFISLQRLITKAHSQLGFYYKPRVSWQDVYDLKNCVVTTACVGGPFKHPEWQSKVAAYNDAFGEDFYCEIQPHNIDGGLQNENNRKAVESAKRFGRKLLATNDFHYANSEDCAAQAALLAIRNKQTESSDDQWDFTPGLYMRSFDEMVDAFKLLQTKGSVVSEQMARSALLTSVEITEKCQFSIPKFDICLPDVDTSEVGTLDPNNALMLLCGKGWKNRFAFEATSKEGEVYFKRLNHELKLIFQLNFAKYFLLVWDLYRFCNKAAIAYGPGRGSGAGSLVCYLLGITNADPLQYGLIFERFINPERIDLPDLDLDFEHARRGEVIKYLHNTYKHVAHIPTFGGLNVKGALKDVSRYKEVPLEEVNEVSKEIEFNTSQQDKAKLKISDLDADPHRYPKYTEFKRRNFVVVDIAKVLEGQVKQTGIHAGGVIVSGEPLENRVAIEYRKGDPSINFDMYDVGDYLGLLKVDVLGSTTVSVLDYTVKMVNKKMQAKYNPKASLQLDKLPLDEPKTLKEFDRGNTTGIFQFESDGIRKLLQQMAPHDINTIITANAMYRPGPLQFSGTYIKQKANPHLIVSTGNAALDRITRETYGVFIYQEQVMQIAVDVAGYTYPESDALRKKISKSKGKEEVEKDRDKFVKGCVEFGKLSLEVANKLFDSIVDFGRYCFNKSHATTYSLVSYYGMWLKVHYPHEFITAKIAFADDKEDRKILRDEAKRLGIKFLPPDINHSEEMCSIQEISPGVEALRGGLNEIDGIGMAVIEEVLKTRGKQHFTSFQDFYSRLGNRRAVNVGVQERLLKAGAFRELHDEATVKNLVANLRTPVSKKTEPFVELARLEM
jgi:DNA polymerase-3 subunit alpha